MSETDKKHTILIVEDEAALRSALSDKFIREGFSVSEAKDGEAGYELALSLKPDLILLDMMMPKTDGMTMLKKLRPQNEWSKKVPVLLLTNFGSDNRLVMREIADDPAAHYLVKSNWPIEKLVTKVRETLAGRPYAGPSAMTRGS